MTNIDNNIIIFRLYLIIAIMFLLPICFFITIGLLEFIVYYYILFIHNSNINVSNIKMKDIHLLAKYYIKKRKWLTCILMLEWFQEIMPNNDSFYYMYLGLCYQKILYNNIAKYYYLQALNDDPSNLLILQNLAYIYRNDGDNLDAANIYRKMISIDSRNQIAIKYLKSLVNL